MHTKNRILVVDDDPYNIEIVKESLQGQYLVKVASSGEQALALAPEFKPDIVLLDIMMPGMDGYETCRKIKENPVLKFTKVLMVSAKAMVNERLVGYGSGADDYITKPFNDEELAAKVKVYLNLKFIEELDLLKKNVLKFISRDIQKPLSSMVGYGSILSQSEVIPVDERKNLEQIVKSGNQLLDICEKGLLLCDLKEGKEVTLENIEVDEFFKSIIGDQELKAKEKRIKIYFENHNVQTASLDPVLIENAFSLVLQNAIEYSPLNGEVLVFIRNDDSNFIIAVDDRGKGVVERLFHEMSQSDINIFTAGEGVAYSIAEIIAKLHGGELTCTTNQLGGTSVEFCLPRKKI